jgi:hypothetical protein
MFPKKNENTKIVMIVGESDLHLCEEFIYFPLVGGQLAS